MKPEFSRQCLKKYSNIKFHENPSSENRVVPCGRTDGREDGRMERHDEGIVAFHNFVKEPTKENNKFNKLK
jgi:hypothetical protein